MHLTDRRVARRTSCDAQSSSSCKLGSTCPHCWTRWLVFRWKSSWGCACWRWTYAESWLPRGHASSSCCDCPCSRQNTVSEPQACCSAISQCSPKLHQVCKQPSSGTCATTCAQVNLPEWPTIGVSLL